MQYLALTVHADGNSTVYHVASHLSQCQKVYSLSYSFLQADGNSTGTGNPAGYCYKEQPGWSAYREPSFGHGTLDVINATTALWSVFAWSNCL